jgi:hypothetical protein
VLIENESWFVLLAADLQSHEAAGDVCLFILSVRLSAAEPEGPALEIYSMLRAFIFASRGGL